MKFGKSLVQIVVFIGTYPIVFGTDVPPANCVEEQVLDLFTKWRQGDTLPLPLPPLEKVEIQSLTGQYAGYGIKVAFSTGKMNLVGLNNFTVKELLVSMDNLFAAKGAIQFPTLALTADSYDLKGQAYIFYSLKGSGLMKVTFQNVILTFVISLLPNTRNGAEGTQIDDIQLNYSVDGIHVDLADCSWPVNKVLNAEGINIVESYHGILVKEATEGLRSSLNAYLSSVAPEQLTDAFIANCNNNNL